MALAACSSGSPKRVAARSTTPSTSVASSTTTTSSTAPPTSPSTTASGPSRCRSTALVPAVGGTSAAAGTIEVTVTLRSTAAGPCTLVGYPGLQLLGPGGVPLPTDVVRGGTLGFVSMAPATVVVAPGASVAFNIGFTDVPVGGETSCAQSASLLVTPPNAYGHVTLASRLAPCDHGRMAVSPVFLTTGPDAVSMAPKLG
ncbi:MAG: DUF4232 domain-containing protein [Actinomycetota bacterium]|nr:DUF4232 domain-containing protein [Actinomycetota bacterium]